MSDRRYPFDKPLPPEPPKDAGLAFAIIFVLLFLVVIGLIQSGVSGGWAFILVLVAAFVAYGTYSDLNQAAVVKHNEWVREHNLRFELAERAATERAENERRQRAYALIEIEKLESENAEIRKYLENKP